MMKKANKMNALYKAAFILMIVCVALLVAAFFVSYVFEQKDAGVLIAVAGVVLCVTAIVLAMFSKPKVSKAKNHDFADEAKKPTDTSKD